MLTPRIQTSGTSTSFPDICARNASLTAAEETHMIWLNSFTQYDAMEWNGFNNELSRRKDALHTASIYVFGP